MKRDRLVILTAAIAVTAIQWAVFFSPVLYTGPVRAVDAPVANEESGGDTPVIAIATYRESFFKF